MKRIFSKLTLACLIIALVFSMTGCLDALFGPTYYPEEDLTVYAGQGTIRYEYSEKVAVTLNNNGDDSLEINNSPELESHFDKVAYSEGKLFIITDDILTDKKYYMFDLDDYIEHYNVNHEYNDYVLYEYSIEEFKDMYPDYENYDWYGH